MGRLEGNLWVGGGGGKGALPGSMTQPSPWQWLLLRHCPPSILGFCPSLCPDSRALLHRICWSPRQHCSELRRAKTQLQSAHPLFLQGIWLCIAVPLFLLPNLPPRLSKIYPLSDVLMCRSLSCAHVQVGCYSFNCICSAHGYFKGKHPERFLTPPCFWCTPHKWS